MLFNIPRYGRRSWFPHVLEKDDPQLSRKRKASSHYKEEEARVVFASKVEDI